MNVMSSSFGAPTLEAQIRMSVDLDTSALDALREEMGKFEDVTFKIGAAVEESTKKVGEGVDDAVDKVDTGLEAIKQRVAQTIGWATAFITGEMADISTVRDNVRESNEHLREEMRLTSELATKGAQVTFEQADMLAQKMAERMGTTKGVFKKSMDEMAGMGLPDLAAWEKAWTRYADIAAKKGETVEEAVQQGQAAGRSPSAELRYMKSILGDDVREWSGLSEKGMLTRLQAVRNRPEGAVGMRDDANEYIDAARGFIVPHPFTGKPVHIGEAMGAVGDKEDLVAEAQKNLRIQKGKEQSLYIEKLNEEHAAGIKLATAAYKNAAAAADVVESSLTGAIEGGLGGALAGGAIGLLSGGPVGMIAGTLAGGGLGAMAGGVTRGGVAALRVGTQESLARNPETGAVEFRSPVGDLLPSADATPPPTGAADPNSPWNNMPKLPPLEGSQLPQQQLPLVGGKVPVTLEGETVKTAPLTPEARAANALRSNPPQTDLKPWTDMRDQEAVESWQQRSKGHTPIMPTEETQRRMGQTPPARAAGGPVAAGQPYVVGEDGMELFVPSADGHIMPHARGSNPSSDQYGGMEWVHALQISTLDLNSFSLALKRATDQIEQITRQHGGGAGGAGDAGGGRYGSVGGAGVYGFGGQSARGGSGYGSVGGAGVYSGFGAGAGGFRGAGASGSWGGGDGGGGGGGFRGGGGSFGGGGATGEASSYHGGAGTGSTPAHGKLAANQQEAYSTLRSLGYDEDTAKIVTANMSGESLANPANKHWDRSHYSQGIVQWDDQRSEAIRKQFGKYPKDMSIPEQVKAFDWEIKSKYKGAYAGLTDKSASLDQRMYSLVKKYEAPADASGQTRARMGLMRGLKVSDHPGADVGGGGADGAAPTSEAASAGMVHGDDALAAAGIRRGLPNLFSSGRREGEPGENLTQIKLDSGRTVTVNKDAAPHFKGFLNELEKGGYDINSLGGFANRAKRGGTSKSEHAYGNAIDINPAQNPFSKQFKTNLPSNVSDMAAKHGLTWGGDWKGTKDTMHFEWSGVDAAVDHPGARPQPTEIAHAKATATQRPPPAPRPTHEIAHAAATQASMAAEAKRAKGHELLGPGSARALRLPAQQLHPDAGRRNPLGLLDSSAQGVQLGRGQVDVNLKLDKGLQATTPNAKPAPRFDLGVNIDRTGSTTLARGGDPTFFNRSHV